MNNKILEHISIWGGEVTSDLIKDKVYYRIEPEATRWYMIIP